MRWDDESALNLPGVEVLRDDARSNDASVGFVPANRAFVAPGPVSGHDHLEPPRSSGRARLGARLAPRRLSLFEELEAKAGAAGEDSVAMTRLKSVSRPASHLDPPACRSTVIKKCRFPMTTLSHSTDLLTQSRLVSVEGGTGPQLIPAYRR